MIRLWCSDYFIDSHNQDKYIERRFEPLMDVHLRIILMRLNYGNVVLKFKHLSEEREER